LFALIVVLGGLTYKVTRLLTSYWPLVYCQNVLDLWPQATPGLDDVRSRGAAVGASAAASSKTGRIVAGWEGLLDRYAWDWFATYTFADSIHPEAADKLFRVWASKLNRLVAGSNWHKRPADTVRWARGLEWQKRGVLHYHALLYTRQGLNLQAYRFEWAAKWQQLAGGFSKILPCDSATAVRAYIAKYCGKGGEVDLSLDLPTVPPVRVGVRA